MTVTELINYLTEKQNNWLTKSKKEEYDKEYCLKKAEKYTKLKSAVINAEQEWLYGI